eukprot:GHUV01029058.1.p1 GENE.GHUV01029058.1~~GHUV01029058.1.p1  ORF type:complete len:220 (-),score=27.11 GHUV01029058.1:285-944(-)
MKSLAVLFFASLLSVQLQVVLCQSFDCKQLLKTAKYRNKSFTGCQVLAARKAIAIWYATDAANGKNGDIVIRFSIRETDPQLRGWMGLGFSDMGAMTGDKQIPPPYGNSLVVCNVQTRGWCNRCDQILMRGAFIHWQRPFASKAAAVAISATIAPPLKPNSCLTTVSTGTVFLDSLLLTPWARGCCTVTQGQTSLLSTRRRPAPVTPLQMLTQSVSRPL